MAQSIFNLLAQLAKSLIVASRKKQRIIAKTTLAKQLRPQGALTDSLEH